MAKAIALLKSIFGNMGLGDDYEVFTLKTQIQDNQSIADALGVDWFVESDSTPGNALFGTHLESPHPVASRAGETLRIEYCDRERRRAALAFATRKL